MSSEQTVRTLNNLRTGYRCPDDGCLSPLSTVRFLDRRSVYCICDASHRYTWVIAGFGIGAYFAPLTTDSEAGKTLAAYVYSIMNPGEIPEHVKSAMRTFEN
jgi:hypothetical protein